MRLHNTQMEPRINSARQKGFIKVIFDSKGKQGKVQKTVTAYCNTLPSDNTVAFKIEVLPKKIQTNPLPIC